MTQRSMTVAALGCGALWAAGPTFTAPAALRGATEEVHRSAQREATGTASRGGLETK